MSYNRFLLNLLIRVTLITITCFSISYLSGFEKRAFTMVFVILVLIAQVWLLYKYVSKTNRDLAKFLFHLQHKDSSIKYTSVEMEKLFGGLSKRFNLIIDDLQSLKNENEERDLLFKDTIEQIGTGIISYDENEHIRLMNNAAKKLLGSSLSKLNELDRIQEGFYKQIKEIKAGTNQSIKYPLDGNLMHCTFHSRIHKMPNQTLTLLSIQDIKVEMEELEIQSFKKLIRVITHEIMNSLTPITTLTTTIKRGLMNKHKLKTKEEVEQDTLSDILTSSELIEDRTKGLIEFIQKYRSLTKLPKPQFRECNLYDLLSKSKQLMFEDLKEKEIDLKIECSKTLGLMIDENLIIQVLINLLKNAFEALENQKIKSIKLYSSINDHGQVSIHIKDSGKGIDPQILEEIFIPFFTTKPQGNGIGLNFCQQVMRMHKGSIDVQSAPNQGSIFSLQF